MRGFGYGNSASNAIATVSLLLYYNDMKYKVLKILVVIMFTGKFKKSVKAQP